MALDLAELVTAVAENTNAINSAVVLLGNLSEAVEAAAGDPDALKAIVDKINAGANLLSQAVIDNQL